MEFTKKTWKNRIVEFVGRRNLENTLTGEVITVDVKRNEGEILQTGDAFSAENMNDLEKRISDAFGGVSFGVDADGNYGYIKAGADTVIPFKKGGDLQNVKIDYLGFGTNYWTIQNSSAVNNYVQVTYMPKAPALELKGYGVIIAPYTTNNAAQTIAPITYAIPYNGGNLGTQLFVGSGNFNGITQVYTYRIRLAE